MSRTIPYAEPAEAVWDLSFLSEPSVGHRWEAESPAMSGEFGPAVESGRQNVCGGIALGMAGSGWAATVLGLALIHSYFVLLAAVVAGVIFVGSFVCAIVALCIAGRSRLPKTSAVWALVLDALPIGFMLSMFASCWR